MKSKLLFLVVGLLTSLPVIVVSAQSDSDEIISILFNVYEKKTGIEYEVTSNEVANQLQLEGNTFMLKIIDTLKVSGKLFIATSITKEDNNCQACSPHISLATFSETEGNHKLISYHHFMKSGQYGEAPPVEIKYNPRREMAFLVVIPGFTNQGVTVENTQVFYFNEAKGEPVLALLLENTYEDNLGFCEEDEYNCYSYKSELTFKNDQLVVHKKGTLFLFEKGRVVNIDETSSYMFNGSLFKKEIIESN